MVANSQIREIFTSLCSCFEPELDLTHGSASPDAKVKRNFWKTSVIRNQPQPRKVVFWETPHPLGNTPAVGASGQKTRTQLWSKPCNFNFLSRFAYSIKPTFTENWIVPAINLSNKTNCGHKKRQLTHLWTGEHIFLQSWSFSPVCKDMCSGMEITRDQSSVL